MANISRSCHTLRGCNILKRLFCAHALSVAEDVNLLTITASEAGSGTRSEIAHAAKKSTSQHFLGSLSREYTGLIKNGPTSKEQLFRRRIFLLAKAQQYDEMADLVLHMTSTKSNINWHSYLNEKELSGFISLLIEHQYKILNSAVGSSTLSSWKDMTAKGKMNRAKKLRDTIRSIYSNLLYTDSRDHIYGKAMRSNLYNSRNLSGYKLSVSDYENLISLELNNLKLDLASKWFQRFEQQFPNATNTKYMTKKLWILKFRTYCGGLPSVWVSPESDFFSNDVLPRKGRPARGLFLHTFPWRILLMDFLKSYSDSGKKLALDKEIVPVLTYSIGYSKDTQYLKRFIEGMWGIRADGKMIENFEPTANDSSSYPDHELLKAILAAFSYNGDFFQAMIYINGFQDNYKGSVDLSGREANGFWSSVFKWCDINTRFQEEATLQYFLKTTLKKTTNSGRKMSLEEAQKNAEFDYDRYIMLLDDLKQRRSKAMHQLWGLYVGTTSFFSPSAYNTYLKQLLYEHNEADLYDFITLLMKHYQSYHVSPSSFNVAHLSTHKANRTDQTVYKLYEIALKGLIDIKWKSGFAGQCEHLIDTWSLEPKMQGELKSYYREVCIPLYNKMIRIKHREKALEEEKYENEKLLDLF